MSVSYRSSIVTTGHILHRLTGPLPDAWAQMSNLIDLQIGDNKFHGFVPESLCMVLNNTDLAQCVMDGLLDNNS